MHSQFFIRSNFLYFSKTTIFIVNLSFVEAETDNFCLFVFMLRKVFVPNFKFITQFLRLLSFLVTRNPVPTGLNLVSKKELFKIQLFRLMCITNRFLHHYLTPFRRVEIDKLFVCDRKNLSAKNHPCLY